MSNIVHSFDIYPAYTRFGCEREKKPFVYFVCHQMDQIYALFCFFFIGALWKKEKILFIDSMLFITMLYNIYINDADKQITMYWDL